MNTVHLAGELTLVRLIDHGRGPIIRFSLAALSRRRGKRGRDEELIDVELVGSQADTFSRLADDRGGLDGCFCVLQGHIIALDHGGQRVRGDRFHVLEQASSLPPPTGGR